ncbi:MAG: DNA primase [Tenericutes bacterium]|nr:DNA primase [Mycoplasmatota bacterium]
MAGISQQTIDLIRNSADIVDVVGEFVNLQAAGKNMKGLCPFHSEKTPSFFVSKERQIFNCFGCGEKGNSVTFIQKYKHMTYVEALHYLAEKYHIDLEYDSRHVETHNTSDNLYKANDQALKYFQLNLLNIKSGKEALDYLVNRGLDIKTIEEFELGYALNSGKTLFNQLTKDFQPLDLLNAGLINQGDTDYYDLFRGRIMFPIRDESNKVIAFSGRVFGNAENTAKYVNTAQTEIFSKSHVLYNLNNALPHVRKNNRVVLMEGYMDVIKASIAQVKETVCSMGTQLTTDQALKLKKYTDNVVICYDGDRAGKEATYKAIKILEDVKMNVQIAIMPDGMDPDDFITNNPNFKEFIDNNLTDQYEFVYRMITGKKDLTKAREIEVCKNQLFDFFVKTSGTIRDIYLNKFAADALIDINTLKADFHQTQINNRITKTLKSSLVRTKIVPKNLPKFRKAEIVIINYYFYNPEFRASVDAKGSSIFFENKDNWTIMFTAQETNKTFTTGSFLVSVKSSLSENLRDLLDHILFREGYEYTFSEFESCIKTLEEANLNDKINSITEDIEEAKQNGDSEDVIKELYLQRLEIQRNINAMKRRETK